MDQENGEYKTVCDGLLDGYKGKVYGDDDTGTEYDYSCTMQKVIIENGKVVSVTGELEGHNVIVDLSKSDGDSNNKALTITDSRTNIKLETLKDIIPDNTTMDIIEITSGPTFEKIESNLTEIKNFKAFDITLKSNNTNIQPNGKVKISIPIPENFDASKLIVYRLDDDNSKTEYQVTAANGYATFETDHFSIYVLGERVEVSDENQDKTDENVVGTNDTKLPQTGEENNVFVKWLSIVILLGVFWLVSMLLIDREKKKMTKR